jgi:uncharacterized protein
MGPLRDKPSIAYSRFGGARHRLGRRAVLKAGGAAILSTFSGCTRGSGPHRERDSGGGGARPGASHGADMLVPDPQHLLDLPEGFSYVVLQERGATMSDGYRVPGRPDAMSCFAGPDGTWLLMRNHELWIGGIDPGPYFAGQSPPAEAYDPSMPGAVTRLVLDPGSLEVKRSNLVLAGTSWNCAGGPSPWGFLSCEETIEPNHGYVFLCRPDAERVQPAQRIDGYGRFRHEAASVDPVTRIAYLTEDRDDACFYRFVPQHEDDPFTGVLQALRVVNLPVFRTAGLRPGERLRIEWVDVPDPTPEHDSVRLQAQERGAATFARTEGLWLDGRHAFISATTGGPIGRGQVLRLDLRDEILEVLAESTDPAGLDMPDNLCVSPRGVLYVCEDGYGVNRVRRIEPDGRVSAFARNARSGLEFAGACFSPDGSTLFLNLQEDHMTLAVRGPFDADLSDQDGGVEPPGHADTDGGYARAGASSLCVLALAAFLARRRP